MQYIGEHLLPGQIGHFCTLLSLTASLVATIAYFMANRTIAIQERNSWIKLARMAFFLETVAVFSVFAIIYFLISHHYHEYFFAWNHSSRSLQPKYLLACIWEDQSGSFLLWDIWHCVLGWILIWKSKDWEAPVMTAINFAQFCIATMLIGVYFFGNKVGNNPFILWRESMPDLPIFSDPNYLQLPRVHEGNDLNTLLQNYWMVIHPPVLFLGFASTIVPFAYAYAGLINKKHDWVKTAIPWASFSAAVLGLGIMMGAAWAYESLSFGGYWAWDPVENASLVPWITLVAGLHCNIIYKKTGYSLRSTYFFYIIAFVLVLYSTFLTRSGILGDTSVHAFVGSDMTLQLSLFAALFFVPSMILFGIRYKSIPSIVKEENTNSREFWMFVGSLVLFLASMVITAKTSVPVYNKITGSNIAPSEDPVFAYNQIQIFVAIILGLLTATTQYFKYKDTANSYFGKKIGWPTLIALIISICISVFGNIDFTKKGIGFLGAIHVAIFAAVYTTIANAWYIFSVLKGKIRFAGASIAHVGFGLILLGILISSAKKDVLSKNTTGIAVFKKDKNEDPAENITLFQGQPTDMGRYMVTYVQDSFNTEERKRYFDIDFKSKDGTEEFHLFPDLIKGNKGMEGYSANPSSRHYWYKDIFVYISAYEGNNTPDTATYRSRELKVGDTLFYSNGLMILNKVSKSPEEQKARFKDDEIAVFLEFTVVSKEGRRYHATPGVAIKGNGQEMRDLPDTVKSQSLALKFQRLIDKDKGRFEVGIKESASITDLVTLKVYEFPMINLLWMGVIVMTIGFILSIIQRLKSKELATT